ncbi:HET-domain-containing protein [Xylaria sp. FL0933]|nr:HET-domain-containing protein [Xylaria sp. FL0933]
MASRRRLKMDGSEIRLFDLLPGKSAEEIRGTLRIVTFDQRAEFEALSWVWGDPKDTRPIIVDEEPFQATLNLETALRDLRYRRKKRVLWVDAVCINQDDAEEKNVQVGRMHLVYSRARRVLAWMGPRNPDVGFAESYMRTYITKSLTLKSWYWLSLDIRAPFSVKAKLEMALSIVRANAGFLEFLDNPYWTRMWTFQEYSLASRQPLCFFGGRAVQHLAWKSETFGFLGTGSKRIDRILRQLIDDPVASKYLARHLERYYPFDVEVQSMHKRFHQFAGDTDGGVPLHDFNGERSVLYLMAQTIERECSNPHDRVYALYGLCPTLARTYPADYAKPYWLVMLETAIYILKNEPAGGLIFGLFGLRDGHLTDDSYPSWVPDFSARNVALTVDATFVRLFRNPDEGPRLKATADLGILHLWGRSLGACKVTCRFSSEDEVCEAQVRQIWMEPSRLLGCDSNSSTLKNPKDVQMRLTYACVLRLFFGPDRRSRVVAALDKWAQSQLRLTERDGDLNEVLANLRGKALIVTESGFFGIASQHVRDGDIVVLPPMVAAPVLLTTHEQGQGDQPNVYKLVGITYIDGLCEGDFEDVAAQEFACQLDLEEFMIR